MFTDCATGAKVNVRSEGRTTWPFWVKSLRPNSPPCFKSRRPPGEVELGVSLWVRCLAPGCSGIAWVLPEEFRLLDRVAPVPYPTGDSTLERKRAVRRAAKIFII